MNMPVPRKPEGLGSRFEADNGLRVPRIAQNLFQKIEKIFFVENFNAEFSCFI